MKTFFRRVLFFCLILGAQGAFAALPTSGKCGLLAQVPNNYLSFPSGTSQPSNLLAAFDFAASTVTYTMNIATNNAGTIVFSVNTGTVSFSAAAGAAWTTVTFTTSLGPLSFNFLPVNSSNTFLVAGAAGSGIERFTGICQLQ